MLEKKKGSDNNKNNFSIEPKGPAFSYTFHSQQIIQLD